MPKKQKSARSDKDEQANESSGSFSQHDDNAKRVKLDLLSDTKLQDLPIVPLQMILVKAVVMEVMDLKLAKCAWKKKTDPVISRLGSVCSQWSNILTSKHFQAELNRTLNETAEDTIRVEVLQQLSVKSAIETVATLKDEIFTLTKVRDQYYAINVYHRDNMEEVKDVINLPKSHAKCMIACTASNRLYVGLKAEDYKNNPLSVLRIWKNKKNHFSQSKWKHLYGRSIDMLSVTANGGLLTFTGEDWNNPASVAIHDENDSLQLEVFLPRRLGSIRYIIQKSNGNLVVSYDTEKDENTKLSEISTTGAIVRHYESSLEHLSPVNFADSHGRIMIAESDRPHRMELLDSEFNLLGVFSLKQDKGKNYYFYDLKYDSDSSVILRSHYHSNSKKNVLTTFRFTEE